LANFETIGPTFKVSAVGQVCFNGRR